MHLGDFPSAGLSCVREPEDAMIANNASGHARASRGVSAQQQAGVTGSRISASAEFID